MEPKSSRIRPARSVDEIVKEAQDFEQSASSTYPLRIVLRTAQNILNQATNYERDGDLEQTYLFLYRHAAFCLTRVAKHPDRKSPDYRSAVARARKQVAADLARLEQIKPVLDDRYEIYKASKPVTGPVARFIDADQNYNVALRLAKQRYSKRRVDTDDKPEVDDLARLMRNLEPLLLQKEPTPTKPSSRPRDYYPDVPRRHSQDAPAVPAKLQQDKPYGHSRSSSATAAPPVPAKYPRHNHNAPPVPLKQSLPDDAQDRLEFKALSTTEGGKPLRPLFLPTQVQRSFLSAAANNTSRNLETCGILCATLISGALFVSHVVIPQQTSTSDTCDTTEQGDTALFDYVDTNQLLVCGWIHTHPSQTCFLSSRDLHTSLGYQVMLPESIAVVCAPSHEPAYAAFRITDPPGVQTIAACDQKGLFHPHESGDLYTRATRPGHVSELDGLQFELVDLRDP